MDDTEPPAPATLPDPRRPDRSPAEALPDEEQSVAGEEDPGAAETDESESRGRGR